jgi:hypothetical protein
VLRNSIDKRLIIKIGNKMLYVPVHARVTPLNRNLKSAGINLSIQINSFFSFTFFAVFFAPFNKDRGAFV